MSLPAYSARRELTPPWRKRLTPVTQLMAECRA
jgi:hypothetical protein